MAAAVPHSRRRVSAKKDATEGDVAPPPPVVSASAPVVVAAAPADAAVAPVVAATEEVVPTEQQAPADGSDPAKKSRRQHVAEILQIITPPARVRKQFENQGLNHIINRELEPIKQKLSDLARATKLLADGVVCQETTDAEGKKLTTKRDLTDDERAEATATKAQLTPESVVWTQQKVALSKKKIRIASEVPYTLSIVIDDIVTELLGHTAEQTVKEGKKIMQISNLHEGAVESLAYYPLFARLPTFQQTSRAITKQTRDAEFEHHLRRELVVAERLWKKTHGVVAKRVKKLEGGEAPAEAAVVADVPAVVVAAPAPVAPLAAPDVPDEHNHDDKTSFEYYVQQLCQPIKSLEQYKGIRVSGSIKKYLSDLQVEFISVIVSQMQLVSGHIGVKTIGYKDVLHAVELLLVYGQTPQETVSLAPAQFVDPKAERAEATRKADATRAGTPYEAAVLPLVDGFLATRTTTFPNLRFNALKDRVHNTVKQFHDEITAAGDPAEADDVPQ